MEDILLQRKIEFEEMFGSGFGESILCSLCKSEVPSNSSSFYLDSSPQASRSSLINSECSVEDLYVQHRSLVLKKPFPDDQIEYNALNRSKSASREFEASISQVSVLADRQI